MRDDAVIDDAMIREGPPEEAVASLEGVSKRYGREEALREVSFALRPGETTALVGHNGAGKTTLMKLMLGLIRPSGGSVRVLGEDPAGSAFRARRRIGFLPENVAFNPSLTARELLGFYARLKGEPRAAVDGLLERVGLGSAADRRVGGYSKGMRQRLGLAQALLGEPRLLLLDEPTTGLDPALRQSFYDTVRELGRRGATVLLSSHALTELEERAQRVLVMRGGRLVADGAISELRRLADLPVRMRLTLAEDAPEAALEGLPPSARATRSGDVVEIECPEGRKMDVIRRIGALGEAARDLAIAPPSLDDLYAHFQTADGPAR